MGPYRTPTHLGARYFLTIIDDFSKGVRLFLLNDKTESSIQIKNFLGLVFTQFDKRVKQIRSDNYTEFMCLASYFWEHGIDHETLCIGTPQQNGRAERKHRHIPNIARALRFQANLPMKFSGDCVLRAAYHFNRTPSFVLDGATPYEKLYNSPPKYDHVRVFGSLCYAQNRNHKGDKFESRSRRCVFLVSSW